VTPLDRDDGVVLAVGALVLAVFVAAEVAVAGRPGLPLDDSWIHLRFADNFAAGRGFGINPGAPVAGSTAPLWTVLLAGAAALGVPGLAAAKGLGVLAYAAGALATRRVALAAGLGRGAALGAGVTMAALERAAWGALSGMEVPLAVLLVAVAALLATRDRPLGAAGVLGLAALARPEAGLLIPLHAAAGGRPAAAARRLGIAALVLAPALVFNVATAGRLAPATAAAKIEGGLLGWVEGVPDSPAAAARRVGRYTFEWVTRLADDHPALPVLAAAGLGLLRRPALRWLAGALLLHPIGTALVAPYGGPGFQTGRYSAHLLPLAVVAAVAALERLVRALPVRRALRAAVVGLALLPLVMAVGPASRAYARGVENINAMQVRLGRWAARHTPPAAVLAVNDIGAISYFGHRRVLDLMGLVTPEILPYRRHGPDGLLKYLEWRCPDYLVVFPEWFPALVARHDLVRPLVRVRLAENLVAGAAEMVVYETAWNRWGPAPRPCPGRLRAAAPAR
jgi:hypothetical protein